jgi:hypothetical protein
LSAPGPGLTAICATACRKSDMVLAQAKDEANAYLEEVRSGARSNDKECVTCGRGPPLEDNHLASGRHGDLTVPMCRVECHPRFTEGQDLWDARWQGEERSPELDESLLLRGLVDLLRIRADHVPVARSGAYLALSESLREQYAFVARRTK